MLPAPIVTLLPMVTPDTLDFYVKLLYIKNSIDRGGKKNAIRKKQFAYCRPAIRILSFEPSNSFFLIIAMFFHPIQNVL